MGGEKCGSGGKGEVFATYMKGWEKQVLVKIATAGE